MIKKLFIGLISIALIQPRMILGMAEFVDASLDLKDAIRRQPALQAELDVINAALKPITKLGDLKNFAVNEKAKYDATMGLRTQIDYDIAKISQTTRRCKRKVGGVIGLGIATWLLGKSSPNNFLYNYSAGFATGAAVTFCLEDFIYLRKIKTQLEASKDKVWVQARVFSILKSAPFTILDNEQEVQKAFQDIVKLYEDDLLNDEQKITHVPFLTDPDMQAKPSVSSDLD